jgi:hypothetical protein
MWYAIVIVPIFLLLIWNNKKNKEKLYDRKGRSFRENYYSRKKEQQKETDSKDQV